MNTVAYIFVVTQHVTMQRGIMRPISIICTICSKMIHVAINFNLNLYQFDINSIKIYSLNLFKNTANFFWHTKAVGKIKYFFLLNFPFLVFKGGHH